MAEPVTTRTDEDDLLLRFLQAADARIDRNNKNPINKHSSRAVISWLRGLVGRINDDGSLERTDG